MAKPRVTENGILWNGEEIPWLAAEFHYWRNRPQDWPLILQRIKDAGFTVVTSFVQWNVHEYEAGEFDFQGRTVPARNIPRLLELCSKVGLYAHLRPGPACCEWRESGGTSFKTPWRKIYDAFWKVVKAYQVTKGGPLIALQIHNEWFDPIGFYYVFRPVVDTFDGFTTPPMHEWLALATNNFHYISAGYGFQLDHLTEYLKWKYKVPQALARAWRTQFRHFEDAAQSLRDAGVNTFHDVVTLLEREYQNRPFPGTNPRRLFDLMQWLVLHPTAQLRSDVDHARKKTDLIITHNWPSRIEKEYNDLTHLDLSGYDCYARVDVDTWEWIYVSHDFQANRLPFSGEFETGLINPYMWGGLGFYDEAFSRWNLLSFFGSGLRGINLYMFVERDNWCHCPLDERGGRRPTYESVSGVIKTLKDVEWHRRRLAHDVTVVKHLPYYSMATDCFDSFPDRGFNFPWLKDNLYAGFDPKKDFYELFVRLHEKNIDFQTVKVDEGELELGDVPVVVAYSLWFMHRPVAKSLRAFAEEGGWLVLGPQIPMADIACRSMKVFNDLPHASKQRASTKSVQTDTGRRFPCPKGFETFTFPDRKRFTHRVRTSEGKVCGYAMPLEKGGVVVLGFSPSRIPGLLEEILLKWLGAERFVSTGVDKADAGLGVCEGKDPVAIVFNGNPKQPVKRLTLSASAFERGATYRATDRLAERDLGTVMVPRRGRSVRLSLNVPPRDATVVEFTRAGELTADVGPTVSLSSITLTDWKQRAESFEGYMQRYAGAEPKGKWVTLPGGEWTLPAIASGRTFGVQGWFWFRREVKVPEGEGRVFLRLRPVGYHNLIEVYVNGRPVGITMVEKPGGESYFDVTMAILRKGTNIIALRLLRQTLDCHDRGISGFREVALESGTWRHEIKKWLFQQEHLFAGEEQGWQLPGNSSTEWEAVPFPFEATLQRNRDIVWLSSEFDVEEPPPTPALPHGGARVQEIPPSPLEQRGQQEKIPPTPLHQGGRIRIEGKDAQAWVYLNGKYLVKTPYLPVELPLDEPIPGGKNTVVLRIMADPRDTYTTPRDDRYQVFVQKALHPCKVRIDGVKVMLQI